jgi:hypothetical protein
MVTRVTALMKCSVSNSDTANGDVTGSEPVLASCQAATTEVGDCFADLLNTVGAGNGPPGEILQYRAVLCADIIIS